MIRINDIDIARDPRTTEAEMVRNLLVDLIPAGGFIANYEPDGPGGGNANFDLIFQTREQALAWLDLYCNHDQDDIALYDLVVI